MDVINKTGIPSKNKGDGLSSSDFNKINGTVNLNTEASNLYLKSVFDANLEMDTERYYTLSEVVALVPESRRRIGMKVRFLSSSGFYDEQVYVGDDIENENWNDSHNWSHGGNIIDGGEY